MSRLLAVCLFWAIFLLTANLDDERQLLSSLELAAAKVADAVRPYVTGIVTLVRGNDQPPDAGPASRLPEPAKPRLVDLAQNEAPISDVPSTGQAEAVATVVANGTDRTALVIKLQRELKRVGCYAGSGSGDWDDPTRRAMATFDARIGARLSLKAPEPKFLTLVAGYRNRACGPPCPLGHLPDEDGKCTVTAQFANADPTTPVSAPEATAANPSTSTGSWTASVAPTSPQTFATSPMSPMPMTKTPTNTPLTTIAILPNPTIPQARKTSGWGNAAFGLGFQSGAPSQSWHSSRTPEAEQWYPKNHH
jgi:hypothetical protein